MKLDGRISLARALRVKRGDVISFVGGGGKTTSMFRLAGELCGLGWKVVTTTTTHISKEQTHMVPAAIHVDEISSLHAKLDRYGQCLVIGSPDGKGRVYGASSQLIAELQARPDVDAVIVEADGSRSRPFKAPGEHEPVVPERTTILVPIAGLNALDTPLDEDHVHRAELAAGLAQAQAGSAVTEEIMARVLCHPKGGAKLLPPGARLVPLLNKADAESARIRARRIAEQLLASPLVDTVAISSMQQEPPILEAWTPTAAIIPAAGKETALAALEAGLDPVIVVPEPAAGKLEQVLADLPQRTGAVVLLTADSPQTTAEILRALVQAHRRTFARACVPVFEGRRGNFVLFDKSLFEQLREWRGGASMQAFLEQYPEEIIDVPADLTQNFEKSARPEENNTNAE